MADFNLVLSSWSATAASEDGDAALLDTMRSAYRASWNSWGAVWRIFREIRDELGILDDEFAFVNLARCPDPRIVTDDAAILACQRMFPISNLVKGIDARVIFFAKDNQIGKNISITGEGIERFVRRYASGSRGTFDGLHWIKWIKRDAKQVSETIAQGFS